MNLELFRKFKEEYESWLGTPYFHMMAKKGVGADCSLFIAKSLKNIGVLSKIEKKTYNQYWMKSGQELMILSFQKHFDLYSDYQYEFSKILQPYFNFENGDIICFNSNNIKACHHSAIFEDEKIIHSYNGVGVHKTRFLGGWKQRAKYVFRIL